MSIDENGFLDSDINGWIQDHRKTYAGLFELCEAVNRLSQTHLFKLNVHNESLQEVLLALLFIRSLSMAQGCILLIERGMTSESRVILRVLVEILFKLRAISKNSEVAKEYVREDEVQRKKFLNKFKKLKQSAETDQNSLKLDELLVKLNKSIKENDISERQTQSYAHLAGLDEYYNSVYSLFSSSVHTNVRDIQELVRTDEDGNIKEFRYGPDDRLIGHLLVGVIETQILILEDMSKAFNLDLESRLQEFRANLEMQVGKHGLIS